VIALLTFKTTRVLDLQHPLTGGYWQQAELHTELVQAEQWWWWWWWFAIK